jgi:hypothetical protein
MPGAYAFDVRPCAPVALPGRGQGVRGFAPVLAPLVQLPLPSTGRPAAPAEGQAGRLLHYRSDPLPIRERKVAQSFNTGPV